MKRRLFGTVALAAVAFTVLLVGAASGAGPTYSNDFEANTVDWANTGGTITKQPNNYDNPGDYADNVAPSVTGSSFHARLDRTTCGVDTDGAEDSVFCVGPSTGWGGVTPPVFPVGGYTTQVDIYLDTDYANANPDTFAGNMTALTADPTNPAVKGTRFDFTSAINNTAGTHKRDFGFNVSTGYATDTCAGFMITGQTNVFRSGANPNIGQHDPQCIDVSGWYTFKHTFSDDAGALKVLMEIIPVGSATPAASWTILTGIDPINTVGCERYGWFANQEIWGLPIDNPSMTGCGTPPVTTATLNVTKFYDANANGVKDGAEADITGWKVQVANGTTQSGTTPFTASGLAPGNYTASEFSPNEANWFATTPTSVQQTLAAGDNKSVSFGNVCTGDGGGLTVGYWTNKNGQALIGPTQLALLTSLNLVNANGTPFVATNKAAVKSWLSSATGTNMAYMLSAQLAAMALNVSTNNVSGSALVYAPGVTGANALGFITVTNLMAAANAELLANPVTKSGSPYRSYQETLKNALDKANQDTSTIFVQSGPCAFTFPGPVCDAGSGNTESGYNSMPTDIGLACPLQAAYSFEGQVGTKEFGDKVQLNTTSGTAIDKMTVAFSSFACGTSGHWYDDVCQTTAGATFTIPDTPGFAGSGGLHARIYSVKPDGTPDVLLGEAVNNGAIPYRPSADPVNCVDSGTDSNGGDDSGKWYNAAADLCQNGYQFNVSFDFTNIAVSPNQTVIWTVTFNTSNSGINPLGNATACRISGNPGCGYDSLNVGSWTFANAEYAGTDVVDDEAWVDMGSGLSAATGYTPFKPLAEITLQ